MYIWLRDCAYLTSGMAAVSYTGRLVFPPILVISRSASPVSSCTNDGVAPPETLSIFIFPLSRTSKRSSSLLIDHGITRHAPEVVSMNAENSRPPRFPAPPSSHGSAFVISLHARDPNGRSTRPASFGDTSPIEKSVSTGRIVAISSFSSASRSCRSLSARSTTGQAHRSGALQQPRSWQAA